MIAADAENAALFDRAIHVQNVVRRSAADVDHERTKIFLMLREHDLRGGERGENHVLDFERQLFHATDRVLNPRAHAVDDVKIRLELLPEHADRIEHAVLSVDVIMLDDRMQKRVLRGNAHFARVDLHVLDVLLVDLVALLGERDRAAIVEALDVRAGHADINAADHHVALRLRIDHRFVHAFHRGFEIDDLAFAHAPRRRLADAENLYRSIGTSFAHDNADFRSANFETNHEIAACHFD